jgi:hypothetical protein
VTATLRLNHKKFGCPKGLVSSMILIIIYLYTHDCQFTLSSTWSTSTVFLKVGSTQPHGSTKVCQGFQETILHNGGTVLLAVLNLYVQIKICVAPFNTNLSVTDSMHSITASIQKLLDSAVESVSIACQRKSMCEVKQSGYRSVWSWPLIFYR